jgi:3-deoxy-D-manno-octulosonate 8-phosphate phosphatase (KDO 8-P phosphatase)
VTRDSNPHPALTPLEERAKRVRLLVFDVDGVLTDGIILMHADGTESKGFNIKDGAAIVWAQRAGLTVALLSARSSGATTHRAAQLGVRYVQQGVPSKRDGFDRILRDTGTDAADAAFMGDDLLDLPVLRRAGLSAAPADAAAEVRASVDWVSVAGGGRGAVREFVEMLLRLQGRWAAVLGEYDGSA